MVYCSAWGCTNRSEKGVRMYGFPSDVERREKWMAVSRSNFSILTKHHNNRKICEEHFEADQFVTTSKGKTRLRSDAIPTIFVYQPAVKRRKPPAQRSIDTEAVAADHSYTVNSDKGTGTKDSLLVTEAKCTTLIVSKNIPPSAELDDHSVPTTVSVRSLNKNWHEHQTYQKDRINTRPSVIVNQLGQEGSMAEQRGKDAHSHISLEVQQLCEVIRNIGEPKDSGGCDGKVITVKFGQLFAHYVNILGDILLRARKQRLVDFEGEMLWQGKHDHEIITLFQ